MPEKDSSARKTHTQSILTMLQIVAKMLQTPKMLQKQTEHRKWKATKSATSKSIKKSPSDHYCRKQNEKLKTISLQHPNLQAATDCNVTELTEARMPETDSPGRKNPTKSNLTMLQIVASCCKTPKLLQKGTEHRKWKATKSATSKSIKNYPLDHYCRKQKTRNSTLFLCNIQICKLQPIATLHIHHGKYECHEWKLSITERTIDVSHTHQF